ncbi:DUF4440 domain-containing protein [Streptomyces sp. NPDC005805]|uniref:nuclear transport factor 2 family protein n=1 Tax=Streptomyces sp. NPDC005805 TaxID=3157068 RepID=UPI0033C13F16
MTDHQEDAEVAVRAAAEAELRLLDPAVRASPQLVTDLLDPDFAEVGASGRVWDAVTVLAATGAGDVTDEEPVLVTELTGQQLAPGLVHLTYRSEHGGRRVLRSSLWRRTDAGWRLYFHQGTPAAG